MNFRYLQQDKVFKSEQKLLNKACQSMKFQNCHHGIRSDLLHSLFD